MAMGGKEDLPAGDNMVVIAKLEGTGCNAVEVGTDVAPGTLVRAIEEDLPQVAGSAALCSPMMANSLIRLTCLYRSAATGDDTEGERQDAGRTYTTGKSENGA